MPSTTEVGRHLPKEAFYRNLRLSPRQKDAFVHGVEHVAILSSIKESAIHIPAGDTGMTPMTVEARIALTERIESLEKLVRELDTKCRKVRQSGKKNELFAQMRKAEAELE